MAAILLRAVAGGEERTRARARRERARDPRRAGGTTGRLPPRGRSAGTPARPARRLRSCARPHRRGPLDAAVADARRMGGRHEDDVRLDDSPAIEDDVERSVEDLPDPGGLDVSTEHVAQIRADPLMRHVRRRRHRELAVVNLVAAAVVRQRGVVLVREPDAWHGHGCDFTSGMAASVASGRARGNVQGSRPSVRLPRDTVECVDPVERFRARYSFPLDDFQVEAIRAIANDQSVIVSAPTGAGKTLVAEFAIQLALESGSRLAYTTPLKALSNQKYGDFVRAYGEDKVGILTGDVKVNPHAPIVVMTTEILRNALYGSGFEQLKFIVLDECHYMGDEGRGTVWEEIIVAAPPTVQLVGLSATVANVKEIADWISLVHRPIVPIYHPQRPVPLHYSVADLAGDIHDYADVRRGRVRVAGDEPRGPD